MIGPSYFMKPHAETEQGLAAIWKYELLPLLEEQYFGRLNREQVREKFGLDAIREKVGAAQGAVDLVMEFVDPSDASEWSRAEDRADADESKL